MASRPRSFFKYAAASLKSPSQRRSEKPSASSRRSSLTLIRLSMAAASRESAPWPMSMAATPTASMSQAAAGAMTTCMTG